MEQRPRRRRRVARPRIRTGASVAKLEASSKGHPRRPGIRFVHGQRMWWLCDTFPSSREEREHESQGLRSDPFYAGGPRCRVAASPHALFGATVLCWRFSGGSRARIDLAMARILAAASLTKARGVQPDGIAVDRTRNRERPLPSCCVWVEMWSASEPRARRLLRALLSFPSVLFSPAPVTA